MKAFHAYTFASFIAGKTAFRDVLAAEQTNDEVYAIPHDVADISDSVTADNFAFLMPPGCTCKRNGASGQQCDQFDCTCQCDLTAGICDFNCCCDVECTEDEVLAFSSCLDEGNPSPMARMCVEGANAFVDINAKYPLSLSDSAEARFHNLLCVEKDNSAVKGTFFHDQGYPKASQAFSPGGMGTKQIGFETQQHTPVTNSYGAYRFGDPIAAFKISDEELTTAFGGYLVLPQAVDGGGCVELLAAAFGKDKTNSCLRQTDNLALDCEHRFNSMRYISDIFVEKTKGSVVLGTSRQTSNLQSAIPIEVTKFTDSKGDAFTNTKSLPQTSWDEASFTCTNALKRMKYILEYNQTTINSISVEIETADVDIQTSALKQGFEITFVPAKSSDSIERSRAKNNLITRPRSGNPGYIVGRPTLGARKPNANSTVSYVDALKAGFTVMDTGSAGKCDSSSPTGSVVGFATDVYVGCTQSMTRRQLKEFCTSNEHPMLLRRKVGGTENFVYPKWLESGHDFLGIFGNADPLDRRQWVKIESPLDDPGYMVKTRTWVDTEGRCHGMPTRLRYEILWTYVGNVVKPQAKILSARKSYDNGPILRHTLPSLEKQPFAFVTTVSWKFLRPEYGVVKKPPPTLIFSVPHDVFYPFELGKSGAMSSNRRLGIWSGAVFIMSVLLFVNIIF
mmetsp:Transcript_9666/g.20029  ORF Transcript_9666/g.20029 Transcript_9666/m.20029 type:complete len:677 (-) Transcript_9666:44-2074(-)